MATVGVRELKNRLSYYLDLAKSGERVTITERGKEIAVIEPIVRDQEREYLLRLVREGRATWNGGKPRGALKRVRWPGKPLSQIVIEGRE